MRLVALTRYRPGRRWRPRRLTRGRAILALLENTVPARRRPKTSFAALQQVASEATILWGARAEANETAEALLSRVE